MLLAGIWCIVLSPPSPSTLVFLVVAKAGSSKCFGMESRRAGSTGKFCLGWFSCHNDGLSHILISSPIVGFLHRQVLIYWGVLKSIPGPCSWDPSRGSTLSPSYNTQHGVIGMPWCLLGASLPGWRPCRAWQVVDAPFLENWVWHSSLYLPAWCKFPINICHMNE